MSVHPHLSMIVSTSFGPCEILHLVAAVLPGAAYDAAAVLLRQAEEAKREAKRRKSQEWREKKKKVRDALSILPFTVQPRVIERGNTNKQQARLD